MVSFATLSSGGKILFPVTDFMFLIIIVTEQQLFGWVYGVLSDCVTSM